MNERSIIVAVIFLCLGVGCFSGYFVGRIDTQINDIAKYRAKAISLGCGQYNRKTGVYEDVKAIEPLDISQFTVPPELPTTTKRNKK